MAIPVYDYRTDVRNVLVTPQIRSRFLRMEPGQLARRHSHDLGHEVFLVLSGRAVFEVEEDSVELGPGQMCVVLADQLHSVRVVGDEPMTMYLSVSPHIQPTHTSWSDGGERLPPRFMPSRAYDVEADATVSLDTLLERCADAAEAAAEAARSCAEVQRSMGDRLREAAARSDRAAAEAARTAMWDAIFQSSRAAGELAAVWNALAPRCSLDGEI